MNQISAPKKTTGEFWSQFFSKLIHKRDLGSKIASTLVIWAMIQRYLPYQFHALVQRFSYKLQTFLDPYIKVRFFEYTGGHMRSNDAYSAIEHYLASKSSQHAKKLRGEYTGKSVVLKIDEFDEVFDDFQGARLVWSLKTVTTKKSSSDKRYYLLTFHRSHRSLVTGTYLKHVLEQGKAIIRGKRQRKLYTNCDGETRSRWSYVSFEHPASLDTVAMEPGKKKEIIDDLSSFKQGREYYARIGKPWKRGYLLYGPPGTGKSTLIAAIVNFLNYDVYDIELTAVKTNSELRKLLIDIPSKSVVVVEDIDCSIELTSQRQGGSQSESDEDQHEHEHDNDNDPAKKKKKKKGKSSSNVTLSGLLNFIDGIWSASTGERIIIFTTNYVEKLDPALIRRGRMDMHIEMSYCGFDAFKVLAKNYLRLESHDSFETIRGLLEETNITPADVAENLMSKIGNDEDGEICLERLIQVLRRKKDKALVKKEKVATTTNDSSG